MIITITLDSGRTYRKFTRDGRIEVKTKRTLAHWGTPVWHKVTSERIKELVEKAIKDLK